MGRADLLQAAIAAPRLGFERDVHGALRWPAGRDHGVGDEVPGGLEALEGTADGAVEEGDGRCGEPPSPVLVSAFLRRTMSLERLLPAPTAR